MTGRFDGRCVLVTGASRGIGRAVAVAFAAEAARVAVHYRSGAAEAAHTLSLLAGEGHVSLRADLASADEVRGLVDGAADALGGLDVLVNNAGVYLAHPVASVSYDAWQDAWTRTLATNLTGAAHASYCAVPHLRARGGGAIVNVSSRGAFRGEPDHPAYGASKAGLNALGQSLAVALAPYRIQVGTVAPGFTETEMAAPYLEGAGGEALRAQSPTGRVATPEEVAAVVLFLASPEAAFTTGTIVDVNGASYLRS
ncbi:MAG TPA: SDR family oxidoreductase [Frankiaceae bacterium]|nr:SDR family oxidoreductase [Frankiaceae bacterium]